MKILRVQSNLNYNNINFGRKIKNRFQAEDYDDTPKPHLDDDLRDFGYGEYLAKYQKRAFKSNLTPSLKIEKPMPFEETHGKFALDRYQKEAIDSYNSGKTTVVSAPTGTGKTLIAEHIIKHALENNKKIIYLSPLKALSNEKYSDFAKLFGNYDEEGNLISTENVGLLTGDTTINPNAPIMVMTTEIYRNSLLTTDEKGADKKYKDYDGVIYDEFHYLGDKDRGTVWEEAVINTPKHMKQLMLSATASNAKNIIDWIKTTNSKIETHLVNVPERERHVPLREMIILQGNSGSIKIESTQSQNIDIYQIENKLGLSDRQKSALEDMKTILNLKDEDISGFIRDISGTRKFIKAEALSNGMVKAGMEKDMADSISLILSKNTQTKYKDSFQYNFVQNFDSVKVIKELNKKNMTPALFYIFSKRKCEQELENAAKNGENLLTEEESQMVYEEVQKAKDNGVFLGADFDDMAYAALTKGYAVHHAGKLPAYKSLVEKLAQKGLIKACFATETLIAGINMPFRTTVFTAFDKEVEDGIISDIPTHTFKQGAGRAGRRGKDLIGNVVVLPKSYDEYSTYVRLSSSNDTSIKSNYKLSYATLLSDRMLNDKDEAILKTLAVHQNIDNVDLLENEANNRLELLKDWGYVAEKENGEYQRTEKGDFAKKVFGIDEIFFTELLCNPDYLKDFTSTELTALCASYADVKDREPSESFSGEYNYLNNRMDKIFNLSNKVWLSEENYKIDTKPIKFSTNLVPYVLKFANGSKEREESIENWQNILSSLKEKELIAHEGDFLRVVNGTVTLLRLIAELSEDDNIKDEAKTAIKNLKKAPVVDIFNYELQDNAKKSNSTYEF